MKFLSLILAGLRRRLMRSILTGLSIFVAFVLLGVTHGVTAGFNHAESLMSDVRLRVMSRANIIEPMPYAHLHRMGQVEGVRAVAPIAIFPAYFQEPLNNVSAAALHIDSMLDVFPEIAMSPDEVAALKRLRTGATVGKNLADRFGWKIGDQVPLTSYFMANEDGGNTWTFDIVAIHNDGPEDEELIAGEIYFHYDYLNESRVDQKDSVNLFLVSIENSEQAGEISSEIDNLFRNSSDETQTMNEKQFLNNQMRSIGDIGAFISAIQFAVMFTLLFIAGSTMAQSVRERVSEFGVFKAVGFTDNMVTIIVIAEAVVLCLIASLVGLGLAAIIFPSIFGGLGLSAVQMEASVWVTGVIVAIILGMIVAAFPAWQLRRLSIVDALRRT